MWQPMDEKVIEFLQQSNYIENVMDSKSLDQAVIAWTYLVSESLLSTSVLLKTHKLLMLHQPLPGYQRGYWRDHDVVIRRGDIVIRRFPPYAEVPDRIKTWLSVANDMELMFKNNPNNIENFIKNCHVAFENIHPFADGNGRIGRMLLNWQRLKVGLPILVIPLTEREQYYDWFKTGGDK
jgi:Fic family protein